jgi:hypothetical protein
VPEFGAQLRLKFYLSFSVKGHRAIPRTATALTKA